MYRNICLSQSINYAINVFTRFQPNFPFFIYPENIMLKWFNVNLIPPYVLKGNLTTDPLDTRRRFNVYKTSIRRWQRRIDVL